MAYGDFESAIYIYIGRYYNHLYLERQYDMVFYDLYHLHFIQSDNIIRMTEYYITHILIELQFLEYIFFKIYVIIIYLCNIIVGIV